MQTAKTQAAIYRSRGARNTLFPSASCKPGYLSVRWVKLSCSSEIHEVEVVVVQDSTALEAARSNLGASECPDSSTLATRRHRKDRKPALGNHQEPGAPPAPHGPESPLPPTLVQRSWDTICSPITPRKAKSTDGGGFPALHDDFLPTATAASTGRHRAAATPAGGSRAPATAPGLHGAARPRTSCPLPQRWSRGLLCPTLPTGTELQYSEPTHE
ncbi:uncharacterized protein LOC117082209 isoform X2 [Trachypithecus francoisi]|uniref:uncharacterized protein LOC117082209 isoform X2 n=1 Tax=Trachypithecus francoisi TaxID=54180 RepID=UPI00141BBB87|nr:uncharacterized protein LOC117082209 isoform X2 [Trachypithecus francoisi]